MRWIIRGANRYTGADIQLEIFAATQAEAESIANARGVLVAEAFLIPTLANPQAGQLLHGAIAQPVYYATHAPVYVDPYGKPISSKRVLAGLMAILFGGLGIHKFVLGYSGLGVLYIFLTLLGFLTCGLTTTVIGVIAFVEGIVYLTKSDDEFIRTYQIGRRGWF